MLVKGYGIDVKVDVEDESQSAVLLGNLRVGNKKNDSLNKRGEAKAMDGLLCDCSLCSNL